MPIGSMRSLMLLERQRWRQAAETQFVHCRYDANLGPETSALQRKSSNHRKSATPARLPTPHHIPPKEASAAEAGWSSRVPQDHATKFTQESTGDRSHGIDAAIPSKDCTALASTRGAEETTAAQLVSGWQSATREMVQRVRRSQAPLCCLKHNGPNAYNDNFSHGVREQQADGDAKINEVRHCICMARKGTNRARPIDPHTHEYESHRAVYRRAADRFVVVLRATLTSCALWVTRRCAFER